MSDERWKDELLRIRERLYPYLDVNLKLFHYIVMTPFHHENERETLAVTQTLDPLLDDHPLIRVIPTRTQGCKHHAHYYFGDKELLHSFERTISQISNLLIRFPPAGLPTFSPPSSDVLRDNELTRWACLVYYLGWNYSRWYFRSHAEFVLDFSSDSMILPVSELEQPIDFDCRPALIHQGTTPHNIDKWVIDFRESNCQMPPIFVAYQAGDTTYRNYLESSLAAIDVLLYLISERALGATSNAPESTQMVTKRQSKRTVKIETAFLKLVLRNHHDERKNPKTFSEPLTQEQIARNMNWISKKNNILQAKVSNRMKKIFGAEGMKKYRSFFSSGEVRRGFKDYLDDDHIVDGTYIDDYDAVDDEIESGW